MADIIEVTCPTCGFRWQEDLDWHRENDSIHALGRGSQTGAEQFRFRCPQDGAWVPIESGRKEDGEAK